MYIKITVLSVKMFRNFGFITFTGSDSDAILDMEEI